jgi:poly(3-hydroxybutyrate) depolymerase
MKDINNISIDECGAIIGEITKACQKIDVIINELVQTSDIDPSHLYLYLSNGGRNANIEFGKHKEIMKSMTLNTNNALLEYLNHIQE